MKTSYRAAVAVGLLAGFPVLVVAISAGLLALDAALLANGAFAGIQTTFISVPIVCLLFWGLFSADKPSLDRTPELPVSPQEQPALWALVNELAETVGTRPPDEICLVPSVNAAVSEETRLLGLRVRRRRMFIGAPLLLAFTHDQLRAVLTHELAHYSNKDTRLAGAVYRGRGAMVRTAKRLGSGNYYQQSVGQVFGMYANLYFKVSQRISRHQEIVADEAAGRLVGGEVAAGMLRELQAIHLGWKTFMRDYAIFGWQTRYLPESMSDGFVDFLNDDHRQERLDEVRAWPEDSEPSPYDSHPPTSSRITALEAMPAVANGPTAEHPAHLLLLNPVETLDTALETGLHGKAMTRGRLPWPALINLACRTNAAEAARTGNDLNTLLDRIDAGKPRARDEHDLRDRLSTLVNLRLADAEVARWELSWSEPAAFVLDEPYLSELAPALDKAAAEGGDTTALRSLLSIVS